MGRLCTPQPTFDPVATVIGIGGTLYSCPDIKTLDAHVTWLRYRIKCADPRFPCLVAEFRDDIDLLLDRRAWIEILGCITSEGSSDPIPG
jgi:hypothetical protein